MNKKISGDATLSRDEQQLLDSIDGVSALDLLIALRLEPRRLWRLHELAARIGRNDEATRDALVGLVAHRLVTERHPGHFHTAPLDPSGHAAFKRLATLWNTQRALLVERVSRRSGEAPLSA